jgi:CheY-like chemotaxis protein
MSDRAIILLAEDSEDDILLIKQAFAKANIINPIFVVRDGEEAVLYLNGDGKFANRAEYPLPDLLLLDLKMPAVDGFEVLKWLRSQPSLAALRVVVMTSSEYIRDVNQAYQLGANSFLVKPHDFDDFTNIGRLIHEFWLKTSKAPEISRPDRHPKGNKTEPGDRPSL